MYKTPCGWIDDDDGDQIGSKCSFSANVASNKRFMNILTCQPTLWITWVHSAHYMTIQHGGCKAFSTWMQHGSSHDDVSYLVPGGIGWFWKEKILRDRESNADMNISLFQMRTIDTISLEFDSWFLAQSLLLDIFLLDIEIPLHPMLIKISGDFKADPNG